MYDIQHCFICRPSDSTVSGGCWDLTQDSCDYGIGCHLFYDNIFSGIIVVNRWIGSYVFYTIKQNYEIVLIRFAASLV